MIQISLDVVFEVFMYAFFAYFAFLMLNIVVQTNRHHDEDEEYEQWLNETGGSLTV